MVGIDHDDGVVPVYDCPCNQPETQIFAELEQCFRCAPLKLCCISFAWREFSAGYSAEKHAGFVHRGIYRVHQGQCQGLKRTAILSTFFELRRNCRTENRAAILALVIIEFVPDFDDIDANIVFILRLTLSGRDIIPA